MNTNTYYNPNGAGGGGLPPYNSANAAATYNYQPSGYPVAGGAPQMSQYPTAAPQVTHQQMPQSVYNSPPQNPPPPTGTSQSLFGVVIPGRPCITQFEVVGNAKAVCTIENPMLVPDLVFFLLPGTNNIPPGHGALIYYSVAPFANWVLLGSVSPEKPSGSFRTGWTTNEELIGHRYIQLGISLERLDTIQNIEGGAGGSGVEDRFDIAQKIAMDLFRFTNSFCESSKGGMMVVPTSIFDKWIERFEAKYRLDPNFMLKSTASNLDA